MHANKLKSPIICDVYQLAVEMCRLFFLCMENLPKKEEGLTDLKQRQPVEENILKQ